MEASDLNLYHYIEQHISKSPEVQLLSLDDDNGHGSENHILNLISCKSPEINDQIKLNINKCPRTLNSTSSRLRCHLRNVSII